MPPTTLDLVTTLEPRGPAAAIVLTDEQVASFGAGRTPAVVVTVDGRTARLRVGRMGGENLVGMSKAVRAELGVEPGQQIHAVVVLDAEPRPVELPPELAAALDADPSARRAFDALAPSHRKEHARAVADAKKPETKAKRVEHVLAALAGRAD